MAGAALDVFEKEPPTDDLPLPYFAQRGADSTPGRNRRRKRRKASASRSRHGVSEFLLNGIVNNAVNVPNVDLRTLSLIRPYLGLGEKLGRLLAQIAPHGLRNTHHQLYWQGERGGDGAHHALDPEGAAFPMHRSCGRTKSTLPSGAESRPQGDGNEKFRGGANSPISSRSRRPRATNATRLERRFTVSTHASCG